MRVLYYRESAIRFRSVMVSIPCTPPGLCPCIATSEASKTTLENTVVCRARPPDGVHEGLSSLLFITSRV